MNSLPLCAARLAAACLAAFTVTASAQPPTTDGPRYENDTHLVLPTDYRSWPFIGAGLGMTYDGERGTQAASPDNPRFTHAFVNTFEPEAPTGARTKPARVLDPVAPGPSQRILPSPILLRVFDPAEHTALLPVALLLALAGALGWTLLIVARHAAVT